MIREVKDHNALFADAQERYLQTRDKKVLAEMYSIMLDYCCNLFIQYTHHKGLYWTDEEITEKACDASSRLIERYIRNPDYKVTVSLSAAAHFEKLWVLYNDKDYEMNRVSLEQLTDSMQGKKKK